MKMTSMHLCALTLILAIAMSLAATASLIAATGNRAEAPVPQITNHAAKQNRAEITETRETLNVRCVDGKQMTFCTGWPTGMKVVAGTL